MDRVHANQLFQNVASGAAHVGRRLRRFARPHLSAARRQHGGLGSHATSAWVVGMMTAKIIIAGLLPNGGNKKGRLAKSAS